MVETEGNEMTKTYAVREENGLFRIDLFGLPCPGFRAYQTQAQAEEAIRNMEEEDRFRSKEDAYLRKYGY